MKKISLFFASVLCIHCCFAQDDFTFNRGGTSQTNYYFTTSYDYSHELIVVKASINGKEYRFILDTGAPTTISPRLFNELNPEIITKISISDANERTDSVAIVSLKEITIADLTFRDIPAVVDQKGFFLDCFGADGFIGSNLLRTSVVQFSHSDQMITITDDPKRLNLSRKQSCDLFLNEQSTPHLVIDLENKRAAKELVIFDSGMAGFYDVAMSHYAAFEELSIFKMAGKSRGSNAMGFHGIGLDTHQYRLVLPTMDINGAKFKNATVNTTVDDVSRLGNQLLTFGKVTVDYRNEKFYFEPFFEKELDIYEKKFPIDFVPRDNHLYVGFVWDDALGEKIKVGDQIMAINGEDYENISLCDIIMKKEDIKAEQKMTLTIKNDRGELMETIVEKK